MSWDTGGTNTIPCPHCHEQIYEHAEFCPHCEEFVPLERESFGDEDEDDDGTVPCPNCKQPVFEDAEYCPNCEQYISFEDAEADTTGSNKPAWLIIGVLVCMVIVLMWIL